MYDTGKVVIGLLVFLGLMTFPIYYGFYATTRGEALAEVELLEDIEGECAVAVDFMHEREDANPEDREVDREDRRLIARTEHKEMLDDWRDEAIREGHRMREGVDAGDRFRTKSLSNTCLGCHTNKAEFCDRCHDYVGAEPYCWECHGETAGMH